MDSDLQDRIDNWTPGAAQTPADSDFFPPIFEEASFGIAAIDMQGNFVRVNDAFCELHGRSADDLTTMNVTDFGPAENAADYEASLSAARDGTLPRYENEHQIVRPDGSTRWARITATTVYDSSGDAAYALVQYHDTTALHHAEAVVHEATETLDITWETAPIAIYSVDLTGNVTSWNHQSEEMFGWKAAEVLGHEIPIVSDRPEAEEGLAQLLEGHSIEAVEAQLLHRNGYIVDVVTSASVTHTPDGEMKEIVAFTMDVSRQKAAERELRATEGKMRTILGKTSDTVTVIDAHGKVQYSTGQWSTVLGYPEDFWTSNNVIDLVHPDDVDRAEALLQDGLDFPGVEFTDVVRVRDVAGGYTPIEVVGINLLDDPDVEGIVLTTRNLTEVRRNQELLAAEAKTLGLIARGERIGRIFTSIAEMVERNTEGGICGVMVLDDEGRLQRGAEESNVPDELIRAIVGQRPVRLFQTVIEQRQPLVIRDSEIDPMAQDTVEVNKRFGLRSGWVTPIIDPTTELVEGLICTYFTTADGPTDHAMRVADRAAQLAAIAVDRERIHSELYRQAHFDHLTGLPNRLLIRRQLEDVIAASTSDAGVAVMYLDLDHFKVVNDSLGHRVGDEVLVAFADRLRAVVRPGDLVGRLSADEFLIVLTEIEDAEAVRPIAKRFKAALREPIHVGDAEMVLTASIGVAHSASTSIDALQLLEQADAAMYRAKQRGRDGLAFFDRRMRESARERLDLEHDLRRALDRDELVLHFQPGIDLGSGQICGAEALLRWNHPQRGLLYPTEFIPLAEETGIIVPIGEFVLDGAVGCAATWRQRFPAFDGFKLAVNLSTREIQTPHLVDHVQEVLDRYDYPSDQLSLEITETILLDDAEGALEVLQQLKAIGVALAVDDFGTGYSSLSYLNRFPVDVVKIDRAFVNEIESDGQGSIVATAVMNMARALGLETSAEGVETEQQLEGLRRLDCSCAQGFLFSKAVPADDFFRLLESKPAW